MELKEYIRIIQRWAWLLILGVVLGGAGGYLASSYQTPVYQTSTRAMIMRAPQEKNSDYTYLSDQQLTQTYVQLVTTRPVLDAVAEQLGYSFNKDQIAVQQLRDTQVIQLTVEDQDPQRAVDIANVLVEKLIVQNEILQSGRFTTMEASLQEQIKQMEGQIAGIQTVITQVSTQNLKDQLAQLEAQIGPLQDEVSTLEQEIAALPTLKTEDKVIIAEKQARLEQIKPLLSLYQEIYSNLKVLGKPFENASNENLRLNQLQSTLGLYQQIYINLLTSLESIRLSRLQNTPNVVQIEEAVLPGNPIRPQPLKNTALAAVVGLMLAGGIVFLVEYLDDTLKTPEDVERILGLPVVGFVAEMHYKKKSAEEVYVARQPRSPVSEAFRSLRTNLEFAAVNKPIRTILITSPGPAEGKTTIAANLAAIISQSGKRVALVDADMRRPHVHTILGLPNRSGLSDLFRSFVSAVSVSHRKEDLPHLMVITSGSLPPNPAELLGSERMEMILNELHKLVDIIVIDTPPSLVADAQVLSARADAVLFVVQPGATHQETAKASLEMFKRAGARVVGVVLNRIPRNRSYYYGGYKYYSPYGKNGNYYSPSGNQTAEQEKVRDVLGKPAEIARNVPEESVHRDVMNAKEFTTSPSGSVLTRLINEMDKVPNPDPSKDKL